LPNSMEEVKVPLPLRGVPRRGEGCNITEETIL